MSLGRCFLGGFGLCALAHGLRIETYSQAWWFFVIGAALVMTALYQKAKA